MTARRIVLAGMWVLLLSVCWTLPVSAQGVGAIGGTVMDPTGAVLPGAAVSLSSAQGTVGGSQETVSDARGAYQFLRLVPGPYSVKAQLQGFRTVEQRNIVVNADNTSRADLTLPIGGLEEGVEVPGDCRVGNVRQSQFPEQTALFLLRPFATPGKRQEAFER